MKLLPAITPSEVKIVTFDFSQVASGALSTPSIAKATLVGDDPLAAGLVVGSPSVSGSNVLASVTPSLNNRSYSLLCTVTDAASQIHQIEASLTSTTDAA